MQSCLIEMDSILARESECWNGISAACSVIGRDRGFDVVCLSFHVADWICKQDKECASRAWVARYRRGHRLVENTLGEYLASSSGGPTLFILDLVDYILEEREWVSHCALMFMNKGRLVFINPHGRDSLDYTEYDYIATKSRIGSKQLPTHVDELVVTCLVNYMRKFMPIEWQADSRHNYVGKCLQEDDTIGICFSFPILFALTWRPSSAWTADEIVEGMLFEFQGPPEAEARRALHPYMAQLRKRCDQQSTSGSQVPSSCT